MRPSNLVVDKTEFEKFIWWFLEIKKQALEPITGTPYKAEVVVRFYPEER